MTRRAQSREGGTGRDRRAAGYTTQEAEVLCLAIDPDT